MRKLGLALLLTAAACGGSSAKGHDGGATIDAPPATIDAPGGGGPDGGNAIDGGTTTLPRWVMGYYVGYQRDLYPPASVDFTSITHLVVGPVNPQADGSLDTSFDIDPTMGPAMAQDLATRAHAAGRKALLMIGGAGDHDGFASAASAAHRATFVANLTSFAAANGFDGFDLDWEPLPAGDEPDLQALAADLRAAMPGVLLTIPFGWANANVPDVDGWYATAATLFDRIDIMTYGMCGAYPGWKSWHSSAIFDSSGETPSSLDSSVAAYLAAGVPAAKLGVGIGFYGQCWSAPVTGPRQPIGGATIVADDNTMSFTNIMTIYQPAGTYAYDAVAMAPSLSFASPFGSLGCTWVSYEDATSVAAKGQYVHDHGLGGVIIWTVNQGPALLSAVRDAVIP